MSVVPGPDEVATQQYRVAREPEGPLDGEALAITSDAAQVSDPSASFSSVALNDAAGISVGGGHTAAGMDRVTEQSIGAPDHSRLVSPEHHTSYVTGGSDAQTFETDAVESQDAAPSVLSQEPSLQMSTGFAQPGVSGTSLSWSEQEVEPAHGSAFSPSGFGGSSATSTTVSRPFYSDGAELPPQADPAVIQVADAEPPSEPDPTVNPDNQERA